MGAAQGISKGSYRVCDNGKGSSWNSAAVLLLKFRIEFTLCCRLLEWFMSIFKNIFTTPIKVKKEDWRVTPLSGDFDASQCIVTSVPEPIIAAWSQSKPRLAIVIDNVLSPAECAQWIRDTEALGYEEALVNIGGGRQQKMTDVRNSSRCMVDDRAAAAQIWDRVKSFVPDDYCITHKPLEVNERLRFLRYDKGKTFLCLNPY